MGPLLHGFLAIGFEHAAVTGEDGNHGESTQQEAHPFKGGAAAVPVFGEVRSHFEKTREVEKHHGGRRDRKQAGGIVAHRGAKGAEREECASAVKRDEESVLGDKEMKDGQSQEDTTYYSIHYSHGYISPISFRQSPTGFIVR